MKIYIITDMEGVAGVLNFDYSWEDWAESNRIEEGRRLLTAEINAAVEGFFDAGATEVVVHDGHGWGGIHQTSLDPRTQLVRMDGKGRYPTDEDNFDAIAWVGQHARSGAEFAHMAHTDWFNVLGISVNGVAVGEFGLMAMLGASLGMKPIFGSGDEAFTKEAAALTPGIETVAVKRGLTPGTGDECTYEEYKDRNLSAVHLHPVVARKLIKEGAYKAVKRFIENKDSFSFPPMTPPFEIECKFRSEEGNPPYEWTRSHPSSFAEAWRSMWKKA
jgi:D-amino peptidase